MPRCSNLSPPLAVALATAALLGSSGVARAQEPPPVYQTEKGSSRSFHLDGVTRQEWTDDETFSARSRRMIRMKPRVEAGAKWFQIGVGGDFIYSSDENLGPLGGINQALLRDNYVSRDARLDLAWAKLSPVKYVS